MPCIIVCPSCKQKLRLPDQLVGSGKKFKCPKCSTLVDAPVAGAAAAPAPPRPVPAPHAESSPAAAAATDKQRPPSGVSAKQRPQTPQVFLAQVDDPDDEEDEEEPAHIRRKQRLQEDDDERDEEDGRPRRRLEDDEEEARPKRGRAMEGGDGQWRTVRIGVGLVYAATCLFLGSIGTLLVGLSILLIGIPTNTTGNEDYVTTILWGFGGVAVAMVLAAGILVLAGYACCLAAPSRHGAKVLALVNLLLLCGSVILGGALLVLLAKSAPRLANALNYGVGEATSIAFLFFLRALALNLKARSLARQLFYLAIGAAGLQGVCFVITLLWSLTAAPGAPSNTATPSTGMGPEMSSQSEVLRFAGIGLAIAIFQLILCITIMALLCWYLVRVLQEIDGRKLGRTPATNLVWLAITAVDGVAVVVFVIAAIHFAYMVADRASTFSPNRGGPVPFPSGPSFPPR
jgi:hypothetical protein